MNMLPKKPVRKRNVYLDHAASTPLDTRVREAMEPWIFEHWGNPSAIYAMGIEAKVGIEKARFKVAETLHTQPDTIFFTSGGTEANNMALFGIARAHAEHGKHIIATSIEHQSVLKPLEQLEREGFKVSYLKPDSFGCVNVDELFDLIRPDTILLSIMYANNEIGVINPLVEIGKRILKSRKQRGSPYPYFHTDACQAAASLDLSVERLHVDSLTLNGSKIYGPKGVGTLFIRRGLISGPFIYGGGQENSMRGGTENVAGIIGFAEALKLLSEEEKLNTACMRDLRDRFYGLLSERISDIALNGPPLERHDRLANNLNIRFKGIESEALLLYLDEYGTQCATGSACASHDSQGSHVLRAIGLSKEALSESLRFTLGKNTTAEDIDYVMEYLPGLVEALRRMRRASI